MTDKAFCYFLIAFFAILSQVANGDWCGTKEVGLRSGFDSLLIVGANGAGKPAIWSEEQRHKLTYCIGAKNPKHKEALIKAMKQASSDWMDTANVTFTYMPEHDENCRQGNHAVLFPVIAIVNKRHRTVAKAFFPNSRYEHRLVTFRADLIEGPYSKLVGITRHELGHVLGFRHEQVHPDNSSHCAAEKNPFIPITDYDIASIMHYETCGGKNPRMILSEKDKAGAAEMYPF